jgi:hypothetical protein
MGTLDDILNTWTPYRMSAVLYIIRKLKDAERKESLWVQAMGSRGEKKELDKALKNE